MVWRDNVLIPNVDADLTATSAESEISQIGAELRHSRTARGEHLDGIADHLDVRPVYLFGLEQGDLSTIRGKRKARELLRIYANYLGCNGHNILKRVQPMIANLPQEKAPSVCNIVRSVSLTSTIIFSAAVVLGIAAGGFYASKAFRFDLVPIPIETAKLVPSPVNDDVAKVEKALERLKDLTKSSLESAAGNRALASRMANRQSTAKSLEFPSPVVSKVSNGRGAVALQNEERPVNVLATLLARRGDGAHVYEPENVNARVIVRALKTVRVQVASTSQDYSWSRTMRSKEMMLVPNRDDLALSTDHADGVEILVDGVVLPPLGRSHTIARGLPLTAASLQAALTASRPDNRIKPTF